jgi:hypothetical protein
MFVDDINVLISDSDESLLQTKIDRVVVELETWFNRNDLVLKAGKTGVISFHNTETQFVIKPVITIKKKTVDYASEIKFLGIQITDTLK